MTDTLHLARVSDPATSHDAAARTVEFAEDHRSRVLATLKRFGPMGAEQIADACGLPAYAIRKRLVEIDAETTGDVRKTRSGRFERVWRARG